VNPRQPRTIADALLRVLVQLDLARALIERGRARTRAFTWDASLRAHLAVFDRVARLDLKEPSAPRRGRGCRVKADALP